MSLLAECIYEGGCFKGLDRKQLYLVGKLFNLSLHVTMPYEKGRTFMMIFTGAIEMKGYVSRPMGLRVGLNWSTSSRWNTERTRRWRLRPRRNIRS